jgi:uncharacterized membrane protein
MTQLTQTQIRYPARTVAGIALAAVVLGGIVAGGVQALTQASSDGIPAVSARDQAVLKAAQEWEARYRQIYPSSR